MIKQTIKFILSGLLLTKAAMADFVNPLYVPTESETGDIADIPVVITYGGNASDGITLGYDRFSHDDGEFHWTQTHINPGQSVTLSIAPGFNSRMEMCDGSGTDCPEPQIRPDQNNGFGILYLVRLDNQGYSDGINGNNNYYAVGSDADTPDSLMDTISSYGAMNDGPHFGDSSPYNWSAYGLDPNAWNQYQNFVIPAFEYHTHGRYSVLTWDSDTVSQEEAIAVSAAQFNPDNDPTKADPNGVDFVANPLNPAGGQGDNPNFYLSSSAEDPATNPNPYVTDTPTLHLTIGQLKDNLNSTSYQKPHAANAG